MLLTLNNTNINVMKYCLLFHHSFFFFLYLMGHILILLRSACLCAVLIFSSSLMHCCIIYILQYNKPPLPSTDTKPYFTQSHSPWRDRKDRSYRGCNILIPPPWLRPFDAWRGSTRLTYSKSSTLVHTLLLSPFFLHCRVRESRCRSSCHTCLDRDEEYI